MQDVPAETEAERVCRLGEAAYGRLDVSRFPAGAYVAIDIASGAIVQAPTAVAVTDEAEVAFKGAPYYLRKIGGTPYMKGAARG